MDNEIARRRESIPPPSVSRVMHKMGLAQPADPPAPSPSGPSGPSAPYNGSQTVRGHSSSEPAMPAATAPVVPVPVPVPVPAPAPVAQAMAQAHAPVASPAAEEPFSPGQTRHGVGVPPAKPDSVELLRKRTGTPRLGVPVMPAPANPPPPEDPTQAPVAGVIEPSRARPVTGDPMSTSSAVRGKRAPGNDSQNISHVWFEDEEDGSSRADRARKTISPSVTDMSLYDELPRRRRWGLLIGALAVVLGGAIALAMTLGGGSSSGTSQGQPVAAPAAIADAAPSTIIDPPDAAIAAAAPDAAAPAVAAKPDRRAVAPAPSPSPPAPRVPVGRGTDDLTYTPPPDPGFRRPGGGGTPTPPPLPPAPKDPPKGVSGSDVPQDPYGNPDAPAGGGPEKQAEFFASLGAQQLASGDPVNAATSFKKALELDPKSAAATAGMGEIALRQGLFGDAIAHLQKASRLAPRNPRIFVLLGDAFLALGRNQDAATNFKKALQLDPDNARARDGYNEASSRVPPPTDD
jgi:TolA-binding protein